jgi:hypothetical protein
MRPDREVYENALRHIAEWQPEGQSDAEVVTLLRECARNALKESTDNALDSRQEAQAEPVGEASPKEPA